MRVVLLYSVTEHVCRRINVFPRLVRRFGVERLLRMLVWAWPILICLYFLLANAALTGVTAPAVTVTLLGLALLVQMIANPSFLCLDVIIPARSPSSQQLSLCISLGEWIAQVAVMIGAFTGSTLFANSAARDGFLHGRLVWMVQFAAAYLTAVIAQRITRVDGWRELEGEPTA